jgi:hypothetical protein
LEACANHFFPTEPPSDELHNVIVSILVVFTAPPPGVHKECTERVDETPGGCVFVCEHGDGRPTTELVDYDQEVPAFYLAEIRVKKFKRPSRWFVVLQRFRR